MTLNGRRVLAIFLGFFAVIFLANGSMVYVALDTFTGLDTEDAYRKGRGYNDILADAERQRALGWRANVTTQTRAGPEDPFSTQITVTMTDAGGQPLDGLHVSATFRRPAYAGEDRSLTLKSQGYGLYRGAVGLPAPGNWQLRLAATRADGQTFLMNKRLSIGARQNDKPAS